MGGNKNPVGYGFQHDLQKVSGVQTQDRPAVRMNVSDFLQTGGEPVPRFQARKDQKVMDLSGLAILFINGTDLSGHHKPGFYRIRSFSILYPVFFFQLVQPGPFRFQFFFKLFSPLRMGKIPGSH